MTNHTHTNRHSPLLTTLLAVFTLLAMNSTWASDSKGMADAAEGAKIWAETCNRCHNMRSPTDLTDEEWVASVFHMRIRAGLTGQQARDVLEFLQSSNGSASVSPDAVPVVLKATSPVSDQAIDGQSIYESSCMACHGADGKGVLPGVPDFTASDGPLSKRDGVLLSNVINGFQSPGSPMPMPARGGNAQLSDADVAATLDYIKAAFKP